MPSCLCLSHLSSADHYLLAMTSSIIVRRFPTFPLASFLTIIWKSQGYACVKICQDRCLCFVIGGRCLLASDSLLVCRRFWGCRVLVPVDVSEITGWINDITDELFEVFDFYSTWITEIPETVNITEEGSDAEFGTYQEIHSQSSDPTASRSAFSADTLWTMILAPVEMQYGLNRPWRRRQWRGWERLRL